MNKSPGKPVITVAGLSVTRGAATILHGINWQVDPGQHWVILGANGSGKTSLLSCLTGYLTPSNGEISVLGQRYGHSDWRELRKRVGIVSSSARHLVSDGETALRVVVSGREAVVNLWGDVSPADARRARQILERTECGYLAERRWEVLSQGERQRVLIARALISKCAVLILDEPCAGLDPVARENFLAFLSRLAQSRNAPALIFVTHHVEEIISAFTHALLLKGGRIAAQGLRGRCLTSANLSAIFGSKARLPKLAGRYRLQIAHNPGAVA